MQPPSATPLFIGREIELARLTAALERVSAAWIYGVGGVGKTTLACAWAAGTGRPVVFCDGAAAPLDALIDDARRELGPKSRPEPRTLEAKVDDLARRLDASNACLIVDDAHALGDRAAADLVERLAERLKNGRVVSTSRHRLAASLRAPDRLELQVEGLGEVAARELWASLDQLYGENRRFHAALRSSGGNPYLLRRAHAGPLAGGGTLGDEVRSLSGDARTLALALALSGRALSTRALECLLPDGRLRPALATLVNALIAEVDPSGAARVHDLFRDAMLAQCGDEEKDKARSQLVRVLPEADLDATGLLRETSRQLVALGRFAELDAFLLAHAADAVRAGVTGELLRCVDLVPEAERSMALCIERARAVGRHYDMPLAHEELRRLFEATPNAPAELAFAYGEAAYDVCRPKEAVHALGPLASSSGPPSEQSVRASVRYAAALTLLGRGEEGRHLLAKAAERAADPILRARLALQEAMSLNGEEQWEAAAATLGRARALLTDAELDENAVFVPLTFAVAYTRAGRVDEANALLSKLDLEAPTEDDSARIFIAASRAAILFERGDRLGALALRLEVERLNEALGGVHYAMTSALWLGRTLFVLGRRREAHARIDPWRDRAEELGCVSLSARFRHSDTWDPVVRIQGPIELPSAAHVSDHVRASCLALLARAANGANLEPSPELLRAVGGSGYALDRAILGLARASLARRAGRHDAARRALQDAETEARSENADEDVVPALDAWARETEARRESGAPLKADLVLDATRHELRHGPTRSSLKSRPVLRRLLYALAAKPGVVLSKDELTQSMWGLAYDPLRHDTPLWQNIRRLRKFVTPAGLGVEVDEEGYRLIAPPDFRFVHG
jgi:AAA domain